ncbi:MAG TPA: cellulosome protein, partial [Streptosporangiaceae bacterium]|nr:cellulosome protein [Streptosporangiaceae bacterium]
MNLGTSTGPFDGGASGSLYGLYDQGVPSSNLIQGMGLQTTDTKAQDGQQHPGSDALEIARPFTESGGRDIYIYMTDVYRNFPYERTSYAQYQGYMKTEIQQVLTSPYQSR